ncbi:TlpA family protein disulfide reductase [Nocardioides insulae]|uniref:TlpA family protein disulfide reductase n=1 Tax=Nocardioides insulae TaxID=394734 RepID=UPI0004295955|nr:TlpA disulfide reductase family protein [Nocardioides insulae]
MSRFNLRERVLLAGGRKRQDPPAAPDTLPRANLRERVLLAGGRKRQDPPAAPDTLPRANRRERANPPERPGRPMGAVRRRLAAVLAAGSVVALAACSGADGTNEAGYITGDGQVSYTAVAERDEPVDLKGDSLTGDAELDVAADRGKAVVVNVWWSGCGPCKRELPMLQQAADELEAERPGEVAFVGVNTRDLDPAQGQAFERSTGVSYPSIYDPSGKALLAFHGQVPLFAMPATVVLDDEGRVAAVIRGEIPSKTTLTEVVEDVIGDD